MTKAVHCIATSHAQAEIIVDRLRLMGLPNDSVSVLFPDKSTSKDFAHEKHTKAPEGAAAGGAVGTGIGAVLGWLAGIGSLAIPGVGPFIAAGPIIGALSGAGVGAATGGLLGGLVGLGFPEYEAKRYEGKIKEGNILISAHTENSDQRSAIKKIFEEAGAEDIAVTGEETV